jgi:hypothetical protein
MKLTDKQIGEILYIIRHDVKKLSLQRFVDKYGVSFGIPDYSTLSRYEKADRRPSVAVLEAYVREFPVEAKAIRLHLDSATPVNELDRRSITIRQVPDGSFEVHEEAETVVDTTRYLYAYSAGRDSLTELRRRLPRLFGYRILPAGEELEQRVAEMHRGEPLKYHVSSVPGIVGKTYFFHPQRLTEEQVAELGVDISDELLRNVIVYGCELEITSGPKRFHFESTQLRRPTMRDYYWSTLTEHKQILHTIRFQPLTWSTAESFGIHSFFPAADVTHTSSRRNADAPEVIWTIAVDTGSLPGNGWLASWVNA